MHQHIVIDNPTHYKIQIVNFSVFNVFSSPLIAGVQFSQRFSSSLTLQSLSPLPLAQIALFKGFASLRSQEVLTDVIFSIEKSNSIFKSYISLKARIRSLAKLK